METLIWLNFMKLIVINYIGHFHANFYILMVFSSPFDHSPSFKLPTSSCNISTYFPIRLPTLGFVLPRSPWTNYFMYVPALAHTSSTAECRLTRWSSRAWMVLSLVIRVLRWRTRKGVSCMRLRSFWLSSLFLSYSVSSWGLWM